MKNAIFFAIDNNYAFTAANMLVGLHQYCGEMLKTCDIIVYHNGLSEKNARLLTQLHSDIHFEQITFPDAWEEMVSLKKIQKYKGMVLCKLFGFQLIQKYDCVLGLDTDMLIRGDLSDLFTLDTEIAWRKIIAWEPERVFAPLLERQNTDIKAGNGGMVLFTSQVRKHGIDDAAIIEAFQRIKDLEKGGIDELVLAWLAYSYGMQVTELDMDIYNTPAYKALDQTKLLHFLYWRKTTTKPWDNLAAYLYFDDWAENYQKWLALGGDGPVNYTKEDYYKLFAFDKSGEILKLRNTIKRDHLKIAELEHQIEQREQKLKKIQASRGWKFVMRVRRLKDKLRKIWKCFRE